jgi:uncharacterized protein YoxC
MKEIDMAEMSPTEVMALTRDNEFGGSYMWIIVLFALIFGWGGNGFGNNNFANAIGYENLATSNEVQRGFDNQNSMANQREILAAVNAGTMQGIQTTNQVFHDTIGALSDKYQELQRDIAGLAVGQANLLAKENECCCSIQRAIDGVNYNVAMQVNDAVQKLGDRIQGVSDQITGNRMADMQNQINQLQLDQAMNGVVRYPNMFAYNAGNNPFCGCGNYCGNI